jgi:hypothetical protein
MARTSQEQGGQDGFESTAAKPVTLSGLYGKPSAEVLREIARGIEGEDLPLDGLVIQIVAIAHKISRTSDAAKSDK